MNLESNLIQQAQFNPKIKSYILFVVSFFLLISIMGIPILIIWILGLGQHISNRYYKNLECKLTSRLLNLKKVSSLKLIKQFR